MPDNCETDFHIDVYKYLETLKARPKTPRVYLREQIFNNNNEYFEKIRDFTERKYSFVECMGLEMSLSEEGHAVVANYENIEQYLIELNNQQVEVNKIKEAEKKKKINDATLSTWQVRTFWPLFFISIFGGCYSAYTFGERLLKEPQEKTISKEISKQLNFKLDSIAQYQKQNQIETNKLVNQKQDKQGAEISKK